MKKCTNVYYCLKLGLKQKNLLKNLITNILSNSIFRATCEIPYKFCQEKDFEVLNNFHFEFPFELNSVNT